MERALNFIKDNFFFYIIIMILFIIIVSIIAGKSYAFKEGVPTEYIISFDANGGENVTNNIKKTYREHANIPFTFPIREGYEFDGWSESKLSTEAEYSMGDKYFKNKDVTLYAIWKDESIRVDIETYPEGVGYASGNGVHSPGNEVIIKAIPFPGYLFDEWIVETKNIELDDKYLKNNTFMMPTESVRLIAKFVPQKYDYKIEYDSNGGNIKPKRIYRKYGEVTEIEKYELPTREGYTFEGWIESGDTSMQTYMPGQLFDEERDLMLYANWSKNQTLIDDTQKEDKNNVEENHENPKEENHENPKEESHENPKEESHENPKKESHENPKKEIIRSTWRLVEIEANENDGKLMLIGKAQNLDGIKSYAWSDVELNDEELQWIDLSPEKTEIQINNMAIREGMYYFYVKDICDNVIFALTYVNKLSFYVDGKLKEYKYKAVIVPTSIIDMTQDGEFNKWKARSTGILYNPDDIYNMNKSEDFDAVLMK